MRGIANEKNKGENSKQEILLWASHTLITLNKQEKNSFKKKLAPRNILFIYVEEKLRE